MAAERSALTTPRRSAPKRRRDLSSALETLDATALREADEPRVIAWIHGALEALSRDVRSGALTRRSLRTRLSEALLDDALETSLPRVEALTEASRAIADRPPIRHVAMILPSNVETAVVRPLVWALLARDAVALRVSSRVPGVAGALVKRLVDRDRSLGRALGLITIDRDDDASLRALSAWADAVHAWGHDETIVHLESVMGRRVVAHGSGLSLAVITREGAASLDVDALARDVARHDQRGCLSPAAVVIEQGAAIDAPTLAERLYDALSGLDATWPRGKVDKDELARERAWRDTAQAIADWIGVGERHAVSAEPGAIRDSPGLRNVAVHTQSAQEIDALLARLGPRLKCLGVVEVDVDAWRARAPRGVHVVPIGSMQTPSLLAPADGAPPWTGFVAHAQGTETKSTEEKGAARRTSER